MDVETCPRCGKPLAMEVGTAFLCCLECKRRMLGYASWPVGGPKGAVSVHRKRGEAESAAKGAGAAPAHPVWTDIADA